MPCGARVISATRPSSFIAAPSLSRSPLGISARKIGWKALFNVLLVEVRIINAQRSGRKPRRSTLVGCIQVRFMAADDHGKRLGFRPDFRPDSRLGFRP